MPPTDDQLAYGFVGWNISVFNDNLFPKWDSENFFTVFAVYASAIAGDFTGATMSGTLKDASVAIPKGTILAVTTSSFIYILLIICLGSTFVSYASGDINHIISNNITCIPDCPFGLINDYNSMAVSSALTQTGIAVEPAIAAGLFAQTISSALCSYVAAPQTFQVNIHFLLIHFYKIAPKLHQISMVIGLPQV